MYLALMHSLYLWNDAYFFGGIAKFFFILMAIVAAIMLLVGWATSTETKPVKPMERAQVALPGNQVKSSPNKKGCSFYLAVLALALFVIFLFFLLLAS